jgi:hypothetical protein
LGQNYGCQWHTMVSYLSSLLLVRFLGTEWMKMQGVTNTHLQSYIMSNLVRWPLFPPCCYIKVIRGVHCEPDEEKLK